MIKIRKARATKHPMNIRQQIFAIGIIFLAVLFSCALCFNMYIFSLNKRANWRQNSQELSRMSAILSTHIDHITTILNLVASDADTATVVSLARRGDERLTMPYVRSIIDKLSLLASANKDVYAINLILPTMNRVISDIGQYDLDAFFTRVVSDRLPKLVESEARLPLTIFSGEAASTYSTLNPFFSVQIHAYSQTKYAYAAVVVSQENINNTISRQFGGKNMSVYAITQDGSLYCWYDAMGNSMSGGEILSIYESERDTFRADDRTLDVLRTQMGSLRLVMLFPRNEIESAFAQSWALIGAMALIFLAVALALYTVMIRWFYRPMNNLLANFASQNEEELRENEYLRIFGAMNSMRTSLASLEEKMGTEEVQSQAGARIRLNDMASGVGASRYLFFAVVIEDATGAPLDEKRRSLFALMENRLGLNVLSDSIDARTGVVASADGEIPFEAFREALDAVLSDGDFARMGISRVHAGPEELSTAYYESQAALDAADERTICAFGEFSVSISRFRVTFAQQTALANRLAAGDIEAVRECLENIYTDNADVSAPLKCRLSIYLLDLLMVLASGRNVTAAVEIDPDAPWVRSRNPALLKERVFERYQALCNALKPDELGEAIKQYVENNLRDVNLTLNDVAERVNRSYSYVSSAFSKTCGVPFSIYLQKRRVASAMRLLAETGDSVAKIASSVGYESASSFIRVFKKEIGMTPGQYRDTAKSLGGNAGERKDGD